MTDTSLIAMWPHELGDGNHLGEVANTERGGYSRGRPDSVPADLELMPGQPRDDLSVTPAWTAPSVRLTTLAKVLVVDDDMAHRDPLSSVLRMEGFEVSVASNGASALAELAANGAEMVLLDNALPDVSGIELCRMVRQHYDVPIIMVTSRSSEIDRIVGLEIGADDYVTKPYSPRELVARMRAVLRRWRRPADEEPPPVLVAGPVRIDVERHVVTVADATVRLPLKEFELLELLMRNAGRVLTRRQIIERVWGPGYVGDTKTLDTHIRRLRRRLEPVPAEPRYLLTVRGIGFRFQP